MPVVFLITIAAVLVGIFFAATGRGGELAYEQADHAPLDLGPVSAADVALLRPPTALWGYNMQVTDEALERIARAMRERDVTIAYLQEQLASLARDGSYAEPMGADAREAPESPLAPEVLAFPEASEISDADVIPEATQDLETIGFPQIPEAAGTAETPEAFDPPEVLESPEVVESPQTPLVLKASPAKAHEAATQPSETLQDPEDDEPTQPSEILQDPADHEPTQPSETLQDPEDHEATQPLAPDETQGPQGAFNTHDWWAEQQKAAREEAARRRAGRPPGVAEGDSLASAEEQGW